LQAEINIGMLGHVDHGKTTLTSALTGKWTDTHSEEIKRGISIRLGYADFKVFKCPKCGKFSMSEECSCGGKGELLRKISIIDAPGHETLMTAVIAASNILDGALFLIAANEACPQPQTIEHLIVLQSMGVKSVIIVQTKIDLVTKEKAIENYRQIKAFLKGTVVETAPIIPVSAHYHLNLDELVKRIEMTIKTPERDESAKLRIYISRSFDVNRPGAEMKKLKGGVLGGSIIQGVLKKGEKIEIRPGVVKKAGGAPIPVLSEAQSIMEESESLDAARPGGLIAIGTTLDPSLTKSDALVGSMVGRPGEMPEALSSIKVKYEMLKRTDLEIAPLRDGEPIVVNVHTATGVGVINGLAKGIVTVVLKKPMVAEKGGRVALSKRVGQRWRLAAWGMVV
jgi:translation initiation factor 2 subunit 3